MSVAEKNITKGITKICSLVLLAGLAWTFLANISIFPNRQISVNEICDNAIDDDLDGLIDLNDPDCECEILEPVSLIPNPSFEDLDCCPSQRSQLYCADSWLQASAPTTDLIHMCDWMGWEEFPPPLPFPDGEGIMGFRDGRVRSGNSNFAQRDWKEYAGACLFEPLKANELYQFEFYVGFVNEESSPPINITFFGTTDCDNLPFGNRDPAFGCPTNGPRWEKLGSSLVSGGDGNIWVKTSIEVKPEEDITAIAIGPDCPHVENPVNTYYFFDNLVLADASSFKLRIREVSHPCNSDFTLEVTEEPGITYQWYKDGIALIGESGSQLSQIYGEGIYQVRILEDRSCQISKGYFHFIPSYQEEISDVFCNNGSYEFGRQQLYESGTYIDTFKTVYNCDSIVTLHLEELEELSDTLSATILDGSSYEVGPYRYDEEGEYEVNLTSSLGCDSLLLLQLKFFDFYIPNIFSPNQDGVNDVFRVFGAEDLIEKRDLTILDRWGAKIYHGPEWDGTHNGQKVNPGVFVYIGRLRMNDGTLAEVSGTVTVVR